MGCQLDTSGCVHRHSDGTSVPDWAMFSVRDTEITTQRVFFFQNLDSTAAHYYTQYYTGPNEHCAVAVWPSGRHPTEIDQRFAVISLVTTLTGNTQQNTHSSNRMYIASVLRVRLLQAVQRSLRCIYCRKYWVLRNRLVQCQGHSCDVG